MTGKSELVELYKKKYVESLLTLHCLKYTQCNVFYFITKVECRVFSHTHTHIGLKIMY